MFTVNGKELEYDIFNLAKAEAYESALNQVVEKMNALKNEEDGMTFAQSIRVQCEAVAGCFDTLFGEGTAAYVFDGEVNLILALKSYEELIDGVNNEKTKIEKIAKAVTTKYSGNRAQRRAKKASK